MRRHQPFTIGWETEHMTISAVPDPEFDIDEAPPVLVDEVSLTDDLDTNYPDRFLDRELSWLRFNQRVLELAEDPTLPLLERVRFLAIFASNLDEFFMVRVAGLKRRIAAGVAVRAASGLMPREVLDQIWVATAELITRHARVFREDILPALREEQIDLLRWEDLTRDEQQTAKRLFKQRVFPVLTPLAVDPAHPFPYISGLS
ncbi:MAG TPA: RNA degradosome polyphosphate kinase, partial [Marmoricola sp.]|nr:RNA degradosome polyphosphate kinase [Marmoricola sp.]